MEKKPALTHRLAALWNRPLSRRVVPCLCAAWLLFMMLPLFALCFYDYPSYDGFINILPATEVWAQTGSLMDVLRCAIFASPVIGSYTALLTGEVQTFHQEITQREQALLEAGNAAEARQCVQPLSVSPMMFANDLLVYQASSQNRLVEHMHRYYKLMELLEEYGPGSIPEAEWQVLNAWDDAQ